MRIYLRNFFLTSILSTLMLGMPVKLASQDTTLNPVKWSLKLDPAAKTYKKGEPFTAQVTAQIEEGWHLYSLEEIPNGPRPTRITLAEDQGFTLAGEIEQPVPITKFDENFGVETQFYEESATFAVPLKVSATAKSGATTLVIQTRYQTCNDRLCLPPKTVKLEAQLEIN